LRVVGRCWKRWEASQIGDGLEEVRLKRIGQSLVEIVVVGWVQLLLRQWLRRFHLLALQV
jgi:hypothetical protein